MNILYKSIFILFSFFTFYSCVSINLVDEYNPEIEKNVNNYHIEAASFISTAVEKRLAYGAPKSQKFYTAQGALIRNLLINSQVSSENKSCPKSLLDTSSALAPKHLQNNIISEENITTNNTNSCTYLVLNHLYRTHTSLQEIHKLNNTLSNIISDIALSQIEDAVRIALRNEQSKKGT